MRLLVKTPSGLYCDQGGFFIDPSRSVERAVITHAHGDHIRRGCREYICSSSCVEILRLRLKSGARIRGVDYGEELRLGPVTVSLHPAGHILGSAQIRLESAGEVWVVSGDYKRQSDPSCEPFDVVPCDVFVTEATFARPDYRWETGESVTREILEWWDANRRRRRLSVLFCYALGKAQRILAELAKITDREALVHADMAPFVDCYRAAGIRLLATRVLPRKIGSRRFAGDLLLVPVKYFENSWLARLGSLETAFASGWMRRDGASARTGCNRGFVLSDHADWPDTLRTIAETGARRVLIQHGPAGPLVGELRQQRIEACPADEYLESG